MQSASARSLTPLSTASLSRAPPVLGSSRRPSARRVTSSSPLGVRSRSPLVGPPVSSRPMTTTPSSSDADVVCKSVEDEKRTPRSRSRAGARSRTCAAAASARPADVRGQGAPPHGQTPSTTTCTSPPTSSDSAYDGALEVRLRAERAHGRDHVPRQGPEGLLGDRRRRRGRRAQNPGGPDVLHGEKARRRARGAASLGRRRRRLRDHAQAPVHGRAERQDGGVLPPAYSAPDGPGRRGTSR